MVVTYNRSLKIRKAFTSRPERARRDPRGDRARHGRRVEPRVGDRNGRPPADQRLQVARPRRRASPRSYAKALRNDLEFTVDGISRHDHRPGRHAGAQESRLRLGGPAGDGRPRALRRDPREVPGYRRPRMEEFEYDMNCALRQDRPGRQRQRRHDLGARRVGPQDGRHDLRREPHDGRARQRLHVADQNMQGPIQMMAEETGGLAAINTNDWKSNLDQIARRLLQLLLARLPAGQGRVDRGAHDRGHRQEQGPDGPDADELRREVGRDADGRGGRREPALPAHRQSARHQRVDRRRQALRQRELPAAGPDRGPDRQARARSLRATSTRATSSSTSSCSTSRASSRTSRSSARRSRCRSRISPSRSARTSTTTPR